MIVLPARNRKSQPGRPDATVVARLCHALSDETRLAILDRLRGGEQCVCHLVGLLSAGQSRLSFHLKTLRDAGLVIDRRAGRWVHYSIDPRALDLLESYLASFTGRIPTRTQTKETKEMPASKEGSSCCSK